MDIEVLYDDKDLKIYFNKVLHLHIVKSQYVGLQSWGAGNSNSTYFIEFYLKSTKFKVEYLSKELWKEVLSKLSKHL